MAVKPRTIYYNVVGQKIMYDKRESYNENLLTNTLGVYELCFKMDEEWTDLDKISVYINGTGGITPITVELTNPEIATKEITLEGYTVYRMQLPDQLTAKVTQLTIGLCGYKSNDTSFRFPTNTDSSSRIYASVPLLSGEVYPQQISIIEQIFLKMYTGGGSSSGSTIDETTKQLVQKLDRIIKTNGDGTQFLGNDGNYHTVTAAGTGGAGANMYLATDYGVSVDNQNNTTALQALVDLVAADGGGKIYVPNGTYLFERNPTMSGTAYYAIKLQSNVSIEGESKMGTIFKTKGEAGFTMFYRIEEDLSPLKNCSFTNFTVDGNSITEWAVHDKAFYVRYIENCVFRDLYLDGTGATSMGIDFLVDVTIDSVTVNKGGRLYQAGKPGSSGIGIGIGGYENENFTIVNCKCFDCGNFGIFVESQPLNGWAGTVDNPKGIIIANNIVRGTQRAGFGIRGGNAIIMSNNISYQNVGDGFYVDGGSNISLTGNISSENGKNGIIVSSSLTTISDVSISHNTVKLNYNGIHVERKTEELNNIVISENNVTDCNNMGLYLENNYNGVRIQNNTVLNCKYVINKVFTNDVVAGNEQFVGNVIEGCIYSKDTTQNFSDLSRNNIIKYSYKYYNQSGKGKIIDANGSILETDTGRMIDLICVRGYSKIKLTPNGASDQSNIRWLTYAMDGITRSQSQLTEIKITKADGLTIQLNEKDSYFLLSKSTSNDILLDIELLN